MARAKVGDSGNAGAARNDVFDFWSISGLQGIRSPVLLGPVGLSSWMSLGSERLQTPDAVKTGRCESSGSEVTAVSSFGKRRMGAVSKLTLGSKSSCPSK